MRVARIAVLALLVLIGGCADRQDWCAGEIHRVEGVLECLRTPKCSVTSRDMSVLGDYSRLCRVSK